VSGIADRIRDIVAPRRTTSALPSEPAKSHRRDFTTSAGEDLSAALGGEWRETVGGCCFVVEKRVDGAMRYGGESISDIASQYASECCDFALLTGGAPVRDPYVFLDLETTGLNGGAGTYAFLVGCGSFEANGCFVSRQYVLTRFADERPLLAAVAVELESAGVLVTFNGKSFDSPLLETRHLFHRIDWPGALLPHLDVLHPARRFWSREVCSLTALELDVLGIRRDRDVPGFEVPARYFHFLRTGDARPLAIVLDHNRRDLLSLAGLTARLLFLIRNGPSATDDAREALALGDVFWRARLEAKAHDAFLRALKLTEAVGANGVDRNSVRIGALRALAIVLRRARRYDDAAVCWRQLLGTRGCPPHLKREANEALAIHHEHRVRDLAAARAFALGSLAGDKNRRWDDAVRHRLARIDRKISASPSALLDLA
jgi:uncharacterized protein YprB with RNaseH-like and TPR domain